MIKRELLIATTNPGKVKEIMAFLEHSPFTFLTLSDLPEAIPAPAEDSGTILGNAILKAEYYAKKSGHLTLADDAGMFIDALNGWPGVDTALIADTVEARIALVLAKMKDVPTTERTASFKAVLALYDPENQSLFTAFGTTEGSILTEAVKTEQGFGYDPIFLVSALHKTYAEMTATEKNSISHRGKALSRIKYHLQNTYVPKHIVVPCGLIVKDGKILMNRRNDPHRPEFHGTWEFPGGKVEFGEQMHENMKREIREEVGYEVEIVHMLQDIRAESQETRTYAYQVFLVPYVCRITGGELKPSDEEVMESAWFDLDDVFNQPLLGDNDQMYRAFLPELKEVVAKYKL